MSRLITLYRLFLRIHGGGEIVTATIVYFVAFTPEEFLLNTCDLHNYNVEYTGTPGPETRDGKLYDSDAPELSVEPAFASFGTPVLVYQ